MPGESGSLPPDGGGGGWVQRTGTGGIFTGGGGGASPRVFILAPEQNEGESEVDWRLRQIGAYIEQVPTEQPIGASGPLMTEPRWRQNASLQDLPVQAVWRMMQLARLYPHAREGQAQMTTEREAIADLCRALWKSTPPGRTVRLTRRQWEQLADLYPDDPIPEDDE